LGSCGSLIVGPWNEGRLVRPGEDPVVRFTATLNRPEGNRTVAGADGLGVGVIPGAPTQSGFRRFLSPNTGNWARLALSIMLRDSDGFFAWHSKQGAALLRKTGLRAISVFVRTRVSVPAGDMYGHGLLREAVGRRRKRLRSFIV